jgi:hypothetical protein
MMTFNAREWGQMITALDGESLLTFGSYQRLKAVQPETGVSVEFAEVLANDELTKFAVYCMDGPTNTTIGYLVEDVSALKAQQLLGASLMDMHFRLCHVPNCDKVVIVPSGQSSMIAGTSRTISDALDILTEGFEFDDLDENLLAVSNENQPLADI